MVSITSSKPIILASASPIRKLMLEKVGIAFSVHPANIDEDVLKSKDLPPEKLSQMLAEQKAMVVSNDYPDHLVIGSDQVCALQQILVNKSSSEPEAHASLMQLQGNSHHQHSGAALVYNNTILWSGYESAALTMRPLSADEIDAYIAHDNPIGCAGSYKYESLGKHQFSSVNGPTDAILGLPLQPLLAFMHREGYLSF